MRAAPQPRAIRKLKRSLEGYCHPPKSDKESSWSRRNRSGRQEVGWGELGPCPGMSRLLGWGSLLAPAAPQPLMPSLQLSLQSALTLQPEKVLVHQWDRTAPNLESISSSAKPRALCQAGKAPHD